MARVTVLPLGVEFEVAEGATVFHTAIEQGYRWPTVCQGQGSCRTCFMRVLEGEDHFDEPDDWEQEGLEDLADRSADGGLRVRLACQALVRGDAVVRKTGVKPSKDG
jgi:2Fe-2S ferredoxin